MRRSELSITVFASRIFDILEIPLGLQNFSATDCYNGSVLITLPDLDNVFLIWLNNNALSNPASLKELINCVSEVRCNYLINLKWEASYTFCLLNNLTFTPLNCLGLITRSFTTSIDKNIIIIIFVASLVVLACFVSALPTFLTMRRNPAIQKGNKRIMIVKCKTLNVI